MLLHEKVKVIDRSFTGKHLYIVDSFANRKTKTVVINFYFRSIISDTVGVFEKHIGRILYRSMSKISSFGQVFYRFASLMHGLTSCALTYGDQSSCIEVNSVLTTLFFMTFELAVIEMLLSTAKSKPANNGILFLE